MPWRTPMTERLSFIEDLESHLYTMTELCDRHDISRPTGYKWSERWVADGVDGLKDRSRAPLHCPHRTEERVVRRSWRPGGITRAGVPASCWRI